MKAAPVKGTSDYLPKETALRDYLQRTILDVYKENGFEGRLLSRSVEDSATVTSPLFPWSSCGMTQATILSVPTLASAPYCFFNIISPLMSILIAATGYKIVQLKRK